jgi:DNA-binding transcriptional ArsR family regulator
VRSESTDGDLFQADHCANVLKALGDPLRLRIIALLRQGEMTVSDIAEFLGVELVIASHHLQILKHAQLVDPHREGRYVYYQLKVDMLKNVKERSAQILDLGCCKLEVPCNKEA